MKPLFGVVVPFELSKRIRSTLTMPLLSKLWICWEGPTNNFRTTIQLYDAFSEGIRLVRWKMGEITISLLICYAGQDISNGLGLVEDAIELYEDAVFVMKTTGRQDEQLCATVETLGLLIQSQKEYDRAKELAV
jgi:hypothetical protein